MPDKKHKIFLSYSHNDRAWVDKFVNHLQKQQVSVWYDKLAIMAGDSLQDRIQHALRESSIVVAILSKESVNRPWMFFELGAAVADGKRVIPVLIEGLDVRELPSILTQFHVIVADDPAVAGKIVASAVKGKS